MHFISFVMPDNLPVDTKIMSLSCSCTKLQQLTGLPCALRQPYFVFQVHAKVSSSPCTLIWAQHALKTCQKLPTKPTKSILCLPGALQTKTGIGKGCGSHIGFSRSHNDHTVFSCISLVLPCLITYM